VVVVAEAALVLAVGVDVKDAIEGSEGACGGSCVPGTPCGCCCCCSPDEAVVVEPSLDVSIWLDYYCVSGGACFLSNGAISPPLLLSFICGARQPDGLSALIRGSERKAKKFSKREKGRKKSRNSGDVRRHKSRLIVGALFHLS